MGYLQDGAILLPLLLKYERKNEVNSGLSSKKTSSCKWPIG